MYKEVIIIIVVVSLVIGLDVMINTYTKSSVEELSYKLNELRMDILKKDKESAKSKMQHIKENWEEKYNILAYYIEHDELEKVETELVKLSAEIDMEEYEHSITELDTTIFILEHIQEKEQFDIKSIF